MYMLSHERAHAHNVSNLASIGYSYGGTSIEYVCD